MHLEIKQNYALTLSQTGDRQTALEQLQTVIDGYTELRSAHPSEKRILLKSITASNNYGTWLVNAGRFQESIAIFDKAIELLRTLPEDGGSRDDKLSLLLLNNGMATASAGNALEGRRLIEEALDWKDKLGLSDSQEAVRTRLTLGAILARLNQYGESAETYRIVVDQMRNSFPRDKYPDGTLDMAIAIDNYSVSLTRLDKLEEAVRLAAEANAMFRGLAEKSPGLMINYARSSANVALLNARLQRYDEAVDRLGRAIATYEELFPDGHVDLPNLYGSKAIVLSEMRREQESIDAALHSQELARQLFPSDLFPDGHWVVAQCLDRTGSIYLAAGQLEEAAKYFDQAVDTQNRVAGQALMYISEAEALQFLAVADRFKSHLLSVPLDASRAYQLLSGDKARILEQQQMRVQSLRQARDPSMAPLYEQYSRVRKSLAKLALSPSAAAQNPQALADLQQLREKLEREIAEAVAKQGQGLDQLPAADVDPQIDAIGRLASIVDPATAFVEFFAYEHSLVDDAAEHRRTAGEQRVCAFLFDPNSRTMQRIDFGFAQSLMMVTRRLVAGMQVGTEALPLSELSQLIATPLLHALHEDCNRLWIVPDGIVGSIPFASLIDEANGRPIVERFQCIFYSSMDSLATPEPQLDDQATILAVGDIDYGTTDLNAEVQFTHLPGTRAELDQLKSLFGLNNWHELSGAGVSPELLIDSMQETDIVHLATHAFVTDFARSAVTNTQLETGAVRSTSSQRSPLLATRMALSKANQPAEDAVVTGDQLSLSDLSDSQLVVLSACESGVGERVVGEGVFGLQRAFHVAGASHVVATLWPVSDDDAVHFMEAFYRALLAERLSPAAALQKAQLTLMQQPSPENVQPARLAARRGILFKTQDEGGDSKTAGDAARSDSNNNNYDSPTRSTWGAFFLSVD